ncbi:DNA-binding protein [Chitinophaga sp. SYP-B3965]|uniref:NADPH-dependent F420 reductase n=1 Tax=Chitinophaga sp. SYP-B3965 TaxID=2663120 RepID=UPI0012996258|nr:NAD(P)-binding domain-containing protein [Chitinophaga sp. SYP-B3965]MRG44502.1 DNA-binding protein [Chitinophaga sp. SYP-B3965]
MKAGILGSGIVGTTIGRGLVRLGHSVMIGTRHPQQEKLQQYGGHVGTFAETAAYGEVIFLCTNWAGTQGVIESAGVWNFKKKIIIDVTNPLDGKGPDKAGRLALIAGNSGSGGEQVQAWLPDAHVVKALNTVGNNLMINPNFQEGDPTMLIAGNDNLAKKAVSEILHQMGWNDIADVGHIEMSRYLEGLCVIWCAIGFREGSWNHAFRLLRK